MRVVYDASDDAMYIGGFTGTATDGGCWGGTGSTIARYDNFTKSSTPTLRWQISLPWFCNTANGNSVQKAFDVAGDALFVVTSSNYGSGQGPVMVYDTNTGAQTLTFSGGTIVGGYQNLGWVDIPYGIRAFELQNGRYLVFVEDDLYGKEVMYYW